MNEQQRILVERLTEMEISLNRFFRIKPNKSPSEPEGYTANLKTPEEMDRQGITRWGIMGGDFLVLVDTDKREMYDILSKVLPETFEVTSPRRGVPHKYFIVCGSEVPNRHLHLIGDEEGAGEIRVFHQYLVAPGTEIDYKDLQTGEQKTGQYTITKNVKIARIEYTDFMKAVEPYLGKDKKQPITYEQMRHGVKKGVRHSQGIKYADFLIGIQRFDYTTALHAMREWNKLNDPPMEDHDLERMVEDALGFIASKTPQVGKLGQTENLIDFFLNDIGKRVKKDDPVKISVFATGLSTYLESPINLFLRGESGVGKSYNVTETVKYFPQEDVWYLGGMSQKSLIHGYGTLLNKEGQPIDWDTNPDEPKKHDFAKDDSIGYKQAVEQYKKQKKRFQAEIKDSYTVIDLSRKILVFLEVPEYNTFQMLRPILSHDKFEIEYQFVDKTSAGQLRTMRVIIRGWPATIFLTIDRKYMEELSTRSFSVTPENSEEKIGCANILTNEKVSLPWKHRKETEAFKAISQLIRKLRDLTKKDKIRVIVPFLNLHELFPKQISRDMRDFTHFCEFLQTITLLHYYQRPIAVKEEVRYVLSTFEDVVNALKVYREIFETTRTGTEKRTLEFYHNIMIEKGEEGKKWYLKDLTARYNATAPKKLSERSVRMMLNRLDEIGYINIEEDDVDKRMNVFIPLMKTEEKLQNPVEIGSAIDFHSKMEKGFKIWQTDIAETLPFYYNEKISNDPEEWVEDPISVSQLQSMVLDGQRNISSSVEGGSAAIILNEEIKPKTGKKSETTAKLDSTEKRNISTRSPQMTEEKQKRLGLIPCPYCKMCFATDVDLSIHVSSYHESSSEYARQS